MTDKVFCIRCGTFPPRLELKRVRHKQEMYECRDETKCVARYKARKVREFQHNDFFKHHAKS